jgi:hypothetical protein
LSNARRIAVAVIVSSCFFASIAHAQLIPNGTFDTDLSQWLASLSVSWSSFDAHGLLGTSGSALESNNVAGAGVGLVGLFNCVPYIPGNGIWLSGRIYIASGQSAGFGNIDVLFLSGANCTGAVVPPISLIGHVTQTDTWVPVSGWVPRPAGVVSVRIGFRNTKTAAGGLLQIYLDDVQVRSATGDFNVDGVTDIVLRNSTTGDVGMWLMSGSTIASGALVGSPGGSYTVAGLGDFNGGGRTDILLRDGSGNLGMWLMNGSTIIFGALVGSPGGTYTVAGIGDFDADAKADILLRDAAGSLGLWLMNGSTIVTGAFVGSPGGSYTVAGVADFNGDGKADILLRDLLGNLGLWLMNGSVITTGAFVGSPGGSYSVAEVGDFNGDGKADILLSDSLGNLGMWLMNGATITTGAFVGLAGGFSVADVGDYSGDGKADILLRNVSSGDVSLWTMNGATITSKPPVGPLTTDYTVVP